MIAYYKKILNMSPLLLAYSDAVFSGFQLIASVLVGTYFIKKISIERTLTLGLFSSLLFYIVALFSNNPNILFITYSLNGFGYGLMYTSLISIAIGYFDIEYRNISMGIFQLFFSLGIYLGDSGYKWIYSTFKNGLFSFEINKTIFIITSFIAIISIILCYINIHFNKK